MVKFRVSFLDFIKGPTASALLLTLFSHAKVIFQAYSLWNIASVEPVLLQCLFLSQHYFENY